MNKIFGLFTTLLLIQTSWAQLTPTHNDILIPMRDGELLEGDVYIPEGVTNGEVILIQTPYNKDLFSWSLPMGVGTALNSQPFIWVIVDWRGFYGSFGADLSDFTRGEDGYDICEWIIEQPWHGNRIGTWGPSALGGIQYQTLRENHPNHTCAVPMVATGSQAYESYFYGGVLEEARLEQLDGLGFGVSTVVLANPYDNIVWDFAASSTWFPSEIQIPTLQIGGWYDHHINTMMEFYKDARNMASFSIRDEQWLLVGPWVHGGTGIANIGTTTQGELSYPSAALKSDSMAWDFLSYYLLDAENGWEETAKITYFEMGGNDSWHFSNDDDIHATSTNTLYLDKEGKLVSGNGVQSTAFISNPTTPTPTIGGATLNLDLDQGPYSQNTLDSRSDIITFATAPISTPVSITGRIKIQLFVQSDQPDADIAIRLVDLYPDGRNMLITDGIKRMRFRDNSYKESDQVFMEPEEIYAVEIELPFTNYTWLEGHVIKIYVSGNHSGRFNVNLQDGGEMYTAGTGNIATIRIHHNGMYPSRIILPGDNPALGINENTLNFSTYPNPAGHILNIKGSNLTHYRIFDLLGNMKATGNLTTSNQLPINHLNSGIYLIEVTAIDGTRAIKKFTKH